MKNKIITTFVFFSILLYFPAKSSSPWDPRNSCKKNSYDGAYIGLNLGLDFSENNFASYRNNSYHKSNLSFSGQLGGLILGYGKTKDGIYTGTEISTNFFNSKKQSKVSLYPLSFYSTPYQSKHTIQKNHDISAALRLGKILDNKFLIYTKFHLGLEDVSFLYELNNQSKNFKKKIPHVKLGIGVDYLISKSFALGISYDYKMPKTAIIEFQDVKNKHHLSTSILGLRVIYYF